MNRLNLRKKLGAATLLTLALAVAPVARAQVMEQVPSDAIFVVKINHIQETNTKLADWMKQVGIVEMAPDMADPLATLQTKSGLSAGLDTTGEAAFVLLKKPTEAAALGGDPAMGDSSSKPPVMMLIPVKDYKAFIGQVKLIRSEGEVSVVNFKDDAEEVFVAQRGNYAAISPNKTAITTKADGLKASGLADKQLQDQDVVMFLNFPALRPMILPSLQNDREKLIADFSRGFGPGGGAASQSPLGKVVINQVLNGAEEFVKDAQASTLGLRFTKGGISTTMLAEFTPDSYIGKLAASLKGSDQPLLGGLPAGKYLFFGGAAIDPSVTTQLLNDILTPIEKAMDEADGDTKALRGILDAQKSAMSTVTSSVFGVPMTDGNGGLIKVIGVYKGDAAKLRKAQQVAADPAWTKALSSDAQKMTTVYTPGAKTVDGVQLDEQKLTFNFGDAPQAAMAQQMMTFMYGPNGLDMFNGIIDDKTLLIATGGDEQLLSQAIAAAKSGKDVLSNESTLKAVEAELPKTRMAVMYLPLDNFLTTVMSAVGKMGLPVPPLQLPANLPPIGSTIAGDGSAIRIDTHIPTPLVQALVQAGQQMYMQMNGGGKAPPQNGL